MKWFWEGIKKAWGWLAAGLILLVAFAVWWVSRKQSRWALQRLVELHGDTEERVVKIQDKALWKIQKLDKAWFKRRNRVREKESAAIKKVKRQAQTLDVEALRQKVLGDLDEPL